MVEKQRTKLQNSVPVEKREKHRRYQTMEKEYHKRKQKYDDARLKATKARNEYLLCMDAANSSIQVKVTMQKQNFFDPKNRKKKFFFHFPFLFRKG